VVRVICLYYSNRHIPILDSNTFLHLSSSSISICGAINGETVEILCHLKNETK